MELFQLFETVGKGVDLVFEYESSITDFLIKIQDNGYSAIGFDCTYLEKENLKWIKIIRRLRPKLPMIVISTDLDENIGGEIYETGTFFFQQRPVDGGILADVLAGVMTAISANTFV